MDDLTITRLCAEAMGLDRSQDLREQDGFYIYGGDYPREHYDPLHDDARAMALVKKFRINIIWFEVNAGTPFKPSIFMWDKKPEELNRAICECVAKMPNQATKPE